MFECPRKISKEFSLKESIFSRFEEGMRSAVSSALILDVVFWSSALDTGILKNRVMDEYGGYFSSFGWVADTVIVTHEEKQGNTLEKYRFLVCLKRVRH